MDNMTALVSTFARAYGGSKQKVSFVLRESDIEGFIARFGKHDPNGSLIEARTPM